MSRYEQKLFRKRYRAGVRDSSLFLFLIGLAFVLFRFSDFRGAIFIDASSYARTQGIIVSSRIKESYGRFGKNESYDIHYEFIVGDTKYASDQISFGYKGGADIVQSYIKKYPTGQRVIVFYLPSNPSVSVLEPNVIDDTRSIFVVTCMLLSIAGIGLLWSFIPLNRRKPQVRIQQRAPSQARRPRRSTRS